MQSLDLNSKIPSVSRRKPAYIDVYVDKMVLISTNFLISILVILFSSYVEERKNLSYYIDQNVLLWKWEQGYLNFIQQPLFYIFLDIGPKNNPQQRMFFFVQLEILLTKDDTSETTGGKKKTSFIAKISETKTIHNRKKYILCNWKYYSQKMTLNCTIAKTRRIKSKNVIFKELDKIQW